MRSHDGTTTSHVNGRGVIRTLVRGSNRVSPACSLLRARKNAASASRHATRAGSPTQRGHHAATAFYPIPYRALRGRCAGDTRLLPPTTILVTPTRTRHYASAHRTAPAKRPLSRVTRGSTKTAAQAGRRAAHGAARWLIIKPERSFFHARKRERAGVVRCALARWHHDVARERARSNSHTGERQQPCISCLLPPPRAEKRGLRIAARDPRWVPNPARPSRCDRVLPHSVSRAPRSLRRRHTAAAADHDPCHANADTPLRQRTSDCSREATSESRDTRQY